MAKSCLEERQQSFFALFAFSCGSKAVEPPRPEQQRHNRIGRPAKPQRHEDRREESLLIMGDSRFYGTKPGTWPRLKQMILRLMILSFQGGRACQKRSCGRTNASLKMCHSMGSSPSQERACSMPVLSNFRIPSLQPSNRSAKNAPR